MRGLRDNGFTLLEAVIVLILGAILAVTLAPYLTTSMVHGVRPIEQFQDTLSIYKVMEHITADYEERRNTAWDNNTTVDLTAFRNAIGLAGTNQNNDYGVYSVLANGFIQFNASNTEQSSSTTEILKVTIADASGVRVTSIFTDR